jgi:signal transduction histidine kinase
MRNRSLTPPAAFLVPVPMETFSKAVKLEPGETTIGRDSSNTIRLAHGAVSRLHARITLINDRYELADLNSRNGTYVNRKRIEKSVLRSGDMIHFGNRRFVFQIESSNLEEDRADVTFSLPETVSISEDDSVLDDLMAREAEAAAHTFLRIPESGEDIGEDSAQQAHQRLSLLYRLSEQVRSAKNPGEILYLGLDRIFEALPSAERAVALLREEGTAGPLEARAVRYKDPASEGDTIPISRTVLDRVVSERVAVVSRDILDDVRFEYSNSIRLHNLQSIICVPLIEDRQVMGAIHIDTSDFLNPFMPNDMEFVAAVANEMAISIENDRLQRNALRNERMAAIGMTVTNIAHNIKNLLNLNRNAVELMNQRLEDLADEKMETRWFLVRKGLERMNRLAADMLEFARFESARLTLIDVNAAILEDRDSLERGLEDAGILLEWDLASDLPKRLMNQDQLHRALLNVVLNAGDALQEVENGQITISTFLDDHQRLVVRVSDNGVGIAPEELSQVFQLFYTTKGSEGSGLGLPMVQKFVEALGGRVMIDSEPGKGTAVSMLFPQLNKEVMEEIPM